MSEDTPSRQRDSDLFRAVLNALTTAAYDRGQNWSSSDQHMITRFFLEYIETKGLRIVPYQPDRLMQDAINHALDEGKRMSCVWVGKRRKNTWRYRAALDAAPNWRAGYDVGFINAGTAQEESE